MNYLGHFHLAAPKPSLIVGNLLGDYAHGQKIKSQYPEDIWEGVMMHRHIDSFTDKHPAVREISSFFRADFKKYAPVISDIAIDYLLASDDSRYSSTADLHAFAENIYAILYRYQKHLPSSGQKLIGYMAEQDWLTQYRQHEGIGKAFAYITSRAQYLEPRPLPQTALNILIKNEAQLRPIYQDFIQDIEREF